MRMYMVVATLIAISMLTGCAHLGDWAHNGFKVGPNYAKPATPISDEWIDAYDERVRQDVPPYEDWWHVFNDEHLNELIYATYAQNLTLQEAGLRVLEARAQRGVAVGGLFPQSQTAFGDYSHTQLSRNTFGAPPPGAVRTFDNWGTGFDMVWELDVWGKFRRNIEAADASLDASIENYDDILVILLAETAAAYIDYRTAQQRLAYANANVALQKDIVSRTEALALAGKTNDLDATQARQLLANTRTLIPVFENEQRIANNNLCVLIGVPPHDLSYRLGEGPIPTAPPTVAVGVPADLLRRRPDVQRAERQAATQSALIGVATADLFPSFTIDGTIEYQARNLSDLFRPTSFGGVVGKGFSWNILNYGRLLNNIRVQDARFQQLAVAYQQAVLTANGEAETAINSFLKSQEGLALNRNAVKEAEKSKDLVKIIDRELGGSGTTLFVVGQNLVTTKDSLAVAEGDVAKSLVAVYKALGGGWQIRGDGFASGACFVPADGPAEPEPGFVPLEPIAPPPPIEDPEPIPPPADNALLQKVQRLPFGGQDDSLRFTENDQPIRPAAYFLQSTVQEYSK